MEHLAEYLTFSPLPTQTLPLSVNRYQARQALVLAGLFDRVQPLIDGIQDPTERMLTQVAWNDAPNFRRDHPFLVKIAMALNLTDTDLDALFTTAASL
ncbi:hypothetical protein [Undibacterium sp. CY21W]|uniref:hypothetical protein n=1 Tax=Undibacterium sp. CY21W TaxID=2762293 RepID=UPI00164A52F3|nr:hypothetical protein [Undibacterium sp. CY21W]MBC3927768.1 hypothetical protein [Undibacterium sp. CY21W]